MSFLLLVFTAHPPLASSLRAPLAAGGSLRSPPLPGRHARRALRPHRPPDRRVLLAPALRAALVAVLAVARPSLAAPAPGIASARPGPAALRASPVSASPSTGSALRRARAAAPVSPLVRAFLRNAPALRSAPRRAVLPAPVRAPPPPPPAACCARLPAAPGAPPAAHAPRRLRPAGLAGVVFPNLDAAGLAASTARGGLGSHTPRIDDAGPAMRILALRSSAPSLPPDATVLLD